MDNNCVFCKIINGDIPSSKIYEDEWVFGFKDLHPQAPVHHLLISKIHISGADGINESNSIYVAKIFEAAAKIVKKELIEDGFRIVTNCGKNACQTVSHLHFHLLAGRQLSEEL